ncbi:prolipoprotein diacylglyceryl transferase [Proteinivorax hydrogeniformans]|uniref:Phosphatidylglycerol--prolipoprotein diacylglyceryl transferase n=1 Tax=Proteinivorax hydrogeniformans TaxID=1826727 RepID=A0AAU8HSB4_9FIRM
MYPVLLELGPVTVHSYGLMIALGFVAVILGLRRRAHEIGVEPNDTLDISLLAIVFGMIGARLYYVFIYDFSHYVQNPLDVFAFNQGGLVFHGGLILGTLAVIIYLRIKKVSIVETADIAALLIPVAYAFGRLGCFLNGCCHGIATESFWGVSFGEFTASTYHPTQLYLVALAIGIYGFILWQRPRRTFGGQGFLSYIIIYSVGRFLIEFLRTNPEVFGVFTAAQITSVILICIACGLMPLMRRRFGYEEEDDGSENVEEESTTA